MLGFLWWCLEMWELGATNTELIASKVTPEHCAPPLGSQLPTKPTNSSCEENEDAPHFVAGSESPRRSPNVPTLRMASAADQGTAGIIFHISDRSF